LRYPSAAKGLSQETTKLRDDGRFRSVCQTGKAINLERLEKIDIQLSHEEDAATLAVALEAPEVEFVLSVRLLSQFVPVRRQVFLNALVNPHAVG